MILVLSYLSILRSSLKICESTRARTSLMPWLASSLGSGFLCGSSLMFLLPEAYRWSVGIVCSPRFRPK